MSEVASAYVSLLPSAANWSNKLESQVGPQVKKSGSRMGAFLGASLKTGALGVAAAAGGVIGTALFKGFQRLDAIDQARAKLLGLGNSAKTVDTIMSNALASVKSTAFGLDEAATTAAGVVAAGIKPGKELTGVLKTVADTATIAGMSMADAGNVFSSVAARGKLQGDDLMQLQSRGVPVLAMLAKHYGITAAAASEMVSKGKVDFKSFAAAMHEGVGGAALQSGKTFSGAFANLKASLGRIGANLLSGLFPAVQKGMTQLTGIMSGIEPVAAKVGAAIGSGIAQVGPIISQLAAKIGPTLSSLFATIGPAFAQIGQSVATNFVPVMQSLGTLFTTQILPAVSSLVTFLASRLGPVFAQVGQIISGQVVPIIASLAQFLYGTLYPALVQIASKVATSLKPVFDQLVATFQTQLLPALQKLLAKFKEWQPTIEKVIVVVAKVAGKILELAAAILGRVLPVVIKFAGILLGRLIPAVANVIGIVIKVIAKVIDFGTALVNAVGKVTKFIGDVVSRFGSLHQKVVDALKGAGSWLIETGKNIVRGLISGIGALKGAVTSALLNLIPGPLRKFAGKLGIHSPSRVFHGFGVNIVEGLVNGIKDKKSDVAKSLADLAKAIHSGSVDKLTTALDGFRDHIKDLPKAVRGPLRELTATFSKALDGLTIKLGTKTDELKSLKDQFTSLSSGISQAFVPSDLFSSETLADLKGALTLASANLGSATLAQQQLMKAGVNKDFVTQLLNSGNAALLSQLAEQPDVARDLGAQYAALVKGANTLGDSQATAVLGSKIQQTNSELKQIKAQQKQLPAQIAKELTAALRGHAAKVQHAADNTPKGRV